MTTSKRKKKLPGSKKPIEGKCGAKLRKSEQRYGCARYCTDSPMKGKTRCRRHGGKSLSGIAHPNYQGKGFGQALPGNLSARFTDLMRDPQFLDQRAHIALLDTLLEDTIAAFNDAIEDKWQLVLECVADFKTAKTAKNVDLIYATMNRLIEIDLTNVDKRAIRDQVAKLTDTARKVRESERRRMIEQKQVIALDAVMMVLDDIANEIANNVTDASALSKIAGVFNRYTGDSIPEALAPSLN